MSPRNYRKQFLVISVYSQLSAIKTQTEIKDEKLFSVAKCSHTLLLIPAAHAVLAFMLASLGASKRRTRLTLGLFKPQICEDGAM